MFNQDVLFTDFLVQGFDAASIKRDLKGFGFLVPGQEKREILGSIWASSVFVEHAPDGTVMLRTLMGGARRPELAEGDDETLCARAREELVALMGIAPDAQPTMQQVIRWDRAIPQYTLGHHDRVRAADALESQAPGLFFGGNAYRGVAMIQTVKDAERIAEKVAAFVTARA